MNKLCGNTIFAGSGGGKERLNIKERDLHGDVDRADKADKDFDVKKKSKSKKKPRQAYKGAKVSSLGDKVRNSTAGGMEKESGVNVSIEYENGSKQRQQSSTSATMKQQRNSGQGVSCDKDYPRNKVGTLDTNNNLDNTALMQLLENFVNKSY